MNSTISALVSLQQLDTAAEAVRRRLSELPAADRAIDARAAAAAADVDAARIRLTANLHERRELEKQVAQVDTRLARFEDHKAAVKTNQEFTALLHEITTAKSEKDALEEKILVLLEAADGISAEVKAADTALAATKRAADTDRSALTAERKVLDDNLARLTHDRAIEAKGAPAAVLAKYEQLLKQRRMLAITPINGELCTGCHVRLRPAVAQQIRRNEDIVQCDSCQRILYAPLKDPA